MTIPAETDPERQIPWSPGERIEFVLDSQLGAVDSPSAGKAEVLTVTNKRAIRLGAKGGLKVTELIPLERVEHLEIDEVSRENGKLVGGILLIVLAAVAWFGTRAIMDVPIVSLGLSGFLVLIAVFMLSAYAFPDDEGALKLYTPGSSIKHPLRTEIARRDAYLALHRLFELISDRPPLLPQPAVASSPPPSGIDYVVDEPTGFSDDQPSETVEEPSSLDQDSEPETEFSFQSELQTATSILAEDAEEGAVALTEEASEEVDDEEGAAASAEETSDEDEIEQEPVSPFSAESSGFGSAAPTQQPEQTAFSPAPEQPEPVAFQDPVAERPSSVPFSATSSGAVVEPVPIPQPRVPELNHDIGRVSESEAASALASVLTLSLVDAGELLSTEEVGEHIAQTVSNTSRATSYVSRQEFRDPTHDWLGEGDYVWDFQFQAPDAFRVSQLGWSSVGESRQRWLTVGRQFFLDSKGQHRASDPSRFAEEISLNRRLAVNKYLSILRQSFPSAYQVMVADGHRYLRVTYDPMSREAVGAMLGNPSPVQGLVGAADIWFDLEAHLIAKAEVSITDTRNNQQARFLQSFASYNEDLGIKAPTSG